MRITTIGEILIDFVSTQNGTTVSTSKSFDKKPGGAPANVSVGLARLGIPTGFIGAVGNDEFGIFLKDTLKKENVDISFMQTLNSFNTTLAFVSLDKNGERSFCFYRNPGADTQLSKNHIDEDYIKSSRILHFGSLSLTHQPARDATYKAIKIAKKNNIIVSFDPNIRLSLWKNKEDAYNEIIKAIPLCNILKLSEEESYFLSKKNDLKQSAKYLSQLGPILVFITLGEKGSFAYFKGQTLLCDGYNIKAIDTTGCGDAFTAGVLFKIYNQYNDITSFAKTNDLNLKEILSFANACGAICALKKGAIPSMPSLKKVKMLLKIS